VKPLKVGAEPSGLGSRADHAELKGCRGKVARRKSVVERLIANNAPDRMRVANRAGTRGIRKYQIRFLELHTGMYDVTPEFVLHLNLPIAIRAHDLSQDRRPFDLEAERRSAVRREFEIFLFDETRAPCVHGFVEFLVVLPA
jgi:hypothetical protein